MSPELILGISLVGAALFILILINWIDGKFTRKTKWYKLSGKVIREYDDVPGIKPCTKCGSKDCRLYIDLNIPEISIDKKEVVFSDYFWPKFHIECIKCGSRSKEDGDLSSVINAWNIDSRFQLEENK